METILTLSSSGKFQLAQPLSADNVALLDVILPSEYYNIFETKLQVMVDGKWSVKAFPGGNYKSLFEAARTLQDVLGDLYRVNVDNPRSRLMLEGSCDRLKLTPYLASVFKLPTSVREG